MAIDRSFVMSYSAPAGGLVPTPANGPREVLSALTESSCAAAGARPAGRAGSRRRRTSSTSSSHVEGTFEVPTHTSFRADTVHGVLESAAEADPDARAVSFVGGATFTRGELLAEVRAVAGGLARAGIGPRDRVVLVMGNRPEFLFSYLAVSALGAVSVPLNTALQGDVLTYMLTSVAPCHIVLESSLAPQVMPALATAGAGTATNVWAVSHAEPAEVEGARPFEELLDGEPLRAAAPVEKHDLASILFTSGTTGRSKGVMWSQRTATAFAENATWVMGYGSADVVHTCLPLFHINALHTAFLAALQEGASVVISPRFSASRFWQEILDHGATTTNMLGAMGALLWKQAPQEAERQHRLRLAMVVPFPNDYYKEFEERFHCQVTELYGSTDSGVPLGVPYGERRPASCGVPAPGWTVEVVDELDGPVPPGVAGELVTRPSEPFVGQLGYWREPEKTWAAHRNCWFHTGDLFTRDLDGNFHFQDRAKDTMRVSGENVSAFEVEQVLVGHPRVAEVAVYPVPSEFGEDDIVAAVVVEGAEPFDPAALLEYASPRLAYFSVPRFVELVTELPKTATQKIQKAVLRERAETHSMYDGGRRRRGVSS